MIREAGFKAVPTVMALAAWAMVPTYAQADKPVDSSAVFTPTVWQAAKSEQSSKTTPPPPDKPPPASKKGAAAIKQPPKAAVVKRPIKHADLDKDRQHPQVQRARALLNDWMGQRYGMDWRLRGTKPPPRLRVLAVNQASDEYRQYYALASALSSRLKRSELNLIAMGSLAASDAKSACQQVRWLGNQLDRATPKSRKQRANAELTGGLLAKQERPQAKPAGCAAQAQTVLATARRLQKAFGPLSQWPTAERLWIRPALATAGTSVARIAPKKRSKPTGELPPEQADDTQAKTPTVPVIPHLSPSSKSNISGKRVPTRVRVLGH